MSPWRVKAPWLFWCKKTNIVNVLNKFVYEEPAKQIKKQDWKFIMQHSPNSKSGQLPLSAALVALLVLLDQITKVISVRALYPDRHFILIPGVLELTCVQNRGAAFGILQNAQVFFLIITAAALLVIGYALVRLPADRRYLPVRICLCLIAAGAVGNLIDRLLLTYVRDFIYFSLIDFPVFNVADMYITCATFTLLFLALFYYKDEHDFDFLSLK